MDTITSITKTCESVPEQYEGTLKSGKRFYMRCRFGYGELRVGTQEQWDNWGYPCCPLNMVIEPFVEK